MILKEMLPYPILYPIPEMPDFLPSFLATHFRKFHFFYRNFLIALKMFILASELSSLL